MQNSSFDNIMAVLPPLYRHRKGADIRMRFLRLFSPLWQAL